MLLHKILCPEDTKGSVDIITFCLAFGGTGVEVDYN